MCALNRRKPLSLSVVRVSRSVIATIATALLIGLAASPAVADNVDPAPAVALPFGDIILPLPTMPPSNADPINRASPGDVVTQRYNNLRTGTTLYGALDQRAVSDGKFGLIDKLEVDGVVLAQPLFMYNVEFPNKGRRPAVFVATSTNMVYAFDADTLKPLWDTPAFLGEPFRVDATRSENCTGQMAVTEQEPTVAADGIQSTPVIDVARLRIIVSYRTIAPKSDMPVVPEGGAQRIAALELGTGQLAKGADGRDLDRRVTDNPLWNLVHRNRASLLLDGRHVYLAFAGRCEQPDWPHRDLSFQGWIYAFDAATLAFEGQYRSTREPSDSASLEPTKDPVAGGGIWQASTGLAADGRGSLYFATGNQATGFMAINRPADALGRNLPDSIVRLRIDTRPGSISMTPADWFTPYRKDWLDLQDLDLGSAGVVLIPNLGIELRGNAG